MHLSDYPLSEVPLSARKGLLSTSAVLLGFTFFTATMWAGGTLGQAFSIGQLLWIIVIGNLLLGAYAAALAYIACKSGLTSTAGAWRPMRWAPGRPTSRRCCRRSSGWSWPQAAMPCCYA